MSHQQAANTIARHRSAMQGAGKGGASNSEPALRVRKVDAIKYSMVSLHWRDRFCVLALWLIWPT